MKLNTARLILHPVRMADAKAFFDHASIPEVAKNAGFLPKSIAETKMYLRKSVAEWKQAKPERMTFSILLKREKTWIGSLELRWLQEGVGEIGFFIHPTSWGNGYATEAAKATIRWAFTRGYAHRIQGSCWIKNIPSIKVLAKIGLRKEGRLRGVAKVGKELQDDFIFGITSQDWKSARSAARHRR